MQTLKPPGKWNTIMANQPIPGGMNAFTTKNYFYIFIWHYIKTLQQQKNNIGWRSFKCVIYKKYRV